MLESHSTTDTPDGSPLYSEIGEDTAPSSLHSRLQRELVSHIQQPDFPCVGAKSALATEGLAILTADKITQPDDDRRIYDALEQWSAADDDGRFRSLAVVFSNPLTLDEHAYEAALWARLSALLAEDHRRGQPYDSKVSSDPEHPHFALSFGGRAYFAVGLHPNASRKARRLSHPAIIFNLHDQFAELRREQKYERMREVILARDEEYDGQPNPMVARHGDVSEARQYSGRAVGRDWTCPVSPEARG